MDSIVQARQQVYANFHMREDRLVAINILATHWRNQRKTFVKKTKELASAETGERMVERLLLDTCPKGLQQSLVIIGTSKSFAIAKSIKSDPGVLVHCLMPYICTSICR